jgi:hypothetical protein
VVNDEIILDTEVLQATEMEARQALANVDRDSAEGQRRYDELRRRVLDSQIEKLLVAQYAREQKIYVTEDEMRSAIKDVVKNNNLNDESQLREALKGARTHLGRLQQHAPAAAPPAQGRQHRRPKPSHRRR